MNYFNYTNFYALPLVSKLTLNYKVIFCITKHTFYNNLLSDFPDY